MSIDASAPPAADEAPDWPVPRVTGNAQLALGYSAGALMHIDDPEFAIVNVDAHAGTQVLRHKRTGNRYRMSIVQIAGVE